MDEGIGMLGWLGRMSMENGRFQEAIVQFTEGLHRVPRNLPALAAPFLVDRSECYWQLHQFEYSLQDMRKATDIGLPPFDADEAENRALKWLERGKTMFKEERFANSEQCYTFALCYDIPHMWRAEILSHRAAAFYWMGDRADALKDIQHCQAINVNTAKSAANYWKDTGITAFKRNDCQRAVTQLRLAQQFHPSNDSEFQRSVLSHLASAQFRLQKYEQSIETGKACYRFKSVKSKTEADRWRMRGNQLFNDQKFKLSIQCYTLSLSFTPANEGDLAAFIYSNRSFAYMKTGNFDAALTDAKVCARTRPEWSKAHYRMGSSLMALGMHRAALAAFSSALAITTSDGDGTDTCTLSQILTLALEVEERTQSVTSAVQTAVVQKHVDDAIKNKDWRKLHILFMGGGSDQKYRRGEGGLATGCEASFAPLDEVIKSDIDKREKKAFIKILLKHGAPIKGLPGCKKYPLAVARETEHYDVMNLLYQEGAEDSSAAAREHNNMFQRIKREAIETFEAGDCRRAIQLFKDALKVQEQHRLYSFDDRYQITNYLAQAYFKLGEHLLCLKTGHEMWDMKPQKSQALAEVWKKRGNELVTAKAKLRTNESASDFYTLAMQYTEGTNTDAMSKLLSNRSLSYINGEQYQAALRDADNCVKLKPDWYRGHYRQGSSYAGLKKRKEALSAFCKSFTWTKHDSERQIVARDIISTAMQVPDGTSLVTCNIFSDILNKILKEAVEKQDWETIRFLFLGDAEQRLPAKETKPPLARKCDASVVPIELVMRSSVVNSNRLVIALLERGARVNGQQGCDKTPLALAVGTKDFSMAAAFLRHGADSSSIVLENNREFIARGEKEARYWSVLGTSLLKQHREHRNAIAYLNIALELSDPETDKKIRYDAYFNLADVYFELRWYDECLEAGQMCFKLKPEKSEVEATRWSSRCHTVMDEKRFQFCVEFSTLAIQYVPASLYKGFMSNMLMSRAYARIQMKEHSKALDDLKKVLKTNPDLNKAYEYQGDCCAKLKRPKEAIQAYGKYLERVVSGDSMNEVLRTVVSLAAESGEGTAAVTADLPKHVVENLLRDVIQKKEWKKLKVLFLGGGGPQRHQAGRGGLASGCGASEVPLEQIVSASIPAKERSQLISVLLDNGISVNGLSESCKLPLVTLMGQNNLQLVNKLMDCGADPGRFITDGDTPLHIALRLGIDKESWSYLHALLQKSKFVESKNTQDKHGNTLFHVANFGRINKKKCKAIKILTDNKVNPHLRNKNGKLAIEIPSRNDGRWKLLKDAMDQYKLSDAKTTTEASTRESSAKVLKEQEVAETSATTRSQTQSSEEEWDVNDVDDQPADNIVPATKPVPPKMDKRQKSRDELYNKVLNLIEHLDFEAILLENQQADQSALQHQQQDIEQDDTEEEMEDVKQEVVSEVPPGSNSMATDEKEQGDSIDIDSPFENLPWEVDCTDQVWKVLRSKRVPNRTKKRVIAKIRMLAEGRWSSNLCKRLEGTAKKKDIYLYEAKLSKGARILWEKTVAFSDRCSQNPEIRMQTRESEGRVYSDIIRVWDIALVHDSVEHKIENIVRSHDRGMDCIIKTNLKGFKRDDLRKDVAGEYLPNYYVEKTEDQKKREETKVASKRESSRKKTKEDELVGLFFPPASANEQEYHILKFYSFNSALVNTILQCDSTRVDFPFKVTELEHAIINLYPVPPCPIILLGRSGTGKTTCCLYRLWKEFEKYWKGASRGGPLIPRYVAQETSQPSDTENQVNDDNVATVEVVKEASEIASDSASSREPMSEAYADCKETASQAAENESGCYEHLHQLFVTKNSVLCSEVQKNFRELSHACPDAKDHVAEENNPLPSRLQDVSDTAWPLFINSRDLLLMLDASLPFEPYEGPFFKRAEDGSMLRQIDGWGEEDNNLSYIPTEDSDEEDEVEDENRQTQPDSTAEAQGGTVRSRVTQEKESDPRREITYNVFRNEIWPKMIKSHSNLNYHPTLVWMEIRSFIKGSAEALLTDAGFLSLDNYLELGRKRAPNFSDDDRKVVYDLFLIFQRVRSSNRMFDESDLVFNLHRRLQEGGAPEWSIHRLYVDETQDFTQAELSLLIRCCRHPNDLFFTGDTAQSIMRGIAFRFNDLKSLFFHASKSARVDTRRELVRVPDRLYQLIHNYRSHAGILRLASSVVDLLLNFFPESFDRLEKDQGLFDGPKPVILESCSLTDLAMILRGNRRQTSRIEFGAHQVVLVASDEARESLPEELRHGLVMTIYEAKGLEFDDVLIYNFFKDSQACKEWRVVSDYVKKLEEGKIPSSTGLVEIKEDELSARSSSRPRPLDFDSDRHKVLNSEFKYLYTAITRARVNVWFFDEDEDARSPMFEYFRRLDLVNVVSVKEEGDDTEPLTSMFAERSTSQEWRERGQYFYKKRLWSVAAKCFAIAGEDLMMQKSKAQQQAEDANKLRGQPRLMREEFLKAARQFLDCGMIEEAEICLHNAKQRHLLATLYKRTRKFKQAAKLYKKEGEFVHASECCEMVSDYGQAVEILYQAKKFDKAIDVLERYHTLSFDESQQKEGVVPPKAAHTMERLCFHLADEHYKNREISDMEAVLARLPSASDRIEFLKKRGFFDAVARALEDAGKVEEAAQLLMAHGKFKEAARLSSEPKLVADCFMALARTTVQQKPNDTETILEYLETAKIKYDEAGDMNGKGDALLLTGKVQGDLKTVEEAGRKFNSARNDVGEAETVEAIFELTNDKVPDFPKWILVRTIQRLFSLIVALAKPVAKLTTEDHKMVATCEKHFGLFRSSDSQEHRTFLRSSGSRFTQLSRHLTSKEQNVEGMIDVTAARRQILDFLAKLSFQLVAKIRCLLQDSVAQNTVCNAFSLGFSCGSSSCTKQHANDTRQLFNARFQSALNLVYLDAVVSNFVNSVASIKEAKTLITRLMTKDVREFKSSETLYGLIFPDIGTQGVLLTPRHLVQLRTKSTVKQRMLRFAEYSWETASPHRRTNTDVFIRLSFTLQLISHEGKAKKWVFEEEREFEKEARNQRKVEPSRNGMVEDGQRRGRFNSFLRWWEDGKALLHVHGDVENAAHYFIRRFLSLPAGRPSMPFPSIANTVMILEYQLTACLAMCSRLNASHLYAVCLPETYLRTVEIWNMVNCTNEKHFELFDALDHTARNSRNPRWIYSAMQSLMKYMVELTCGTKYKQFDVVSDAFLSNKALNNAVFGQTERTLILTLTMLCNCGTDIPATCQSIILKSLWKITPEPFVPGRIKDALQSLRNLTRISDVVTVLMKLLGCRHESLFDLRWNGRTHRFDATSTNPALYSAQFDFDISAMLAEVDESRADQQPQQMELKEEADDQEIKSEESDTTVPLLYELKEREERENADMEAAAVTIQRYIRRRNFLAKGFLFVKFMLQERQKQAQQFEKTPTDMELQSDEVRFSKFAVDKFTCGVCGVYFFASSESKDFDEQTQVGADTDESFTEDGELMQQDLEESTQDRHESKRNSHIEETSHVEKVEKFQRYKHFYDTEILPLLRRERRLHFGDRNGDDDGKASRSQVEGLDLQRLSAARSTVIRSVHQMEDKLQWAVTEDLHDAIGTFRGTIEEAENLVNEVADDRGPSGSRVKEGKEFYVEPEEDDDAEDDELKDFPVKKMVKGRQQNKKNRNRKNHRRR